MKVLVIEDDPVAVETLSMCLEMRWPGIEIVNASEGGRGVELVEIERPDVVILELGLPDTDGLEVLRQIRLYSEVPIIVVTGRGEQTAKVRGLEAGADDYIVKPYDPLEILARVKSVLRRGPMPQLRHDEGILSGGGLVIDFANRGVTLEGSPVKLTPTEWNLLYLLARNEGREVPHQVLMQRVWGIEKFDDLSALKTGISRLRAKLGDAADSPRMVFSERGKGYRFTRPQ